MGTNFGAIKANFGEKNFGNYYVSVEQGILAEETLAKLISFVKFTNVSPL